MFPEVVWISYHGYSGNIISKFNELHLSVDGRTEIYCLHCWWSCIFFVLHSVTSLIHIISGFQERYRGERKWSTRSASPFLYVGVCKWMDGWMELHYYTLSSPVLPLFPVSRVCMNFIQCLFNFENDPIELLNALLLLCPTNTIRC